MSAAVGTLREESGHDSPAGTFRFRRKADERKRYGCGRLISGKSGSQSARKAGYRTRRLILNLVAQEGIAGQQQRT